MEDELLRQLPNGGPVTQYCLALSIARLNSRLRRNGVSAYELWTQLNQFTMEQLPREDRDVILQQHQTRVRNHPHSERSKAPKQTVAPNPRLQVGDLVYLPLDHDKTQPRNQYFVVSIEKPWCFVRKFVGTQLRALPYKIRCDDCFVVPNKAAKTYPTRQVESDRDEDPPTTVQSPLPPPANIPPALTAPCLPPHHPVPTNPNSQSTVSTRPQRTRCPPKYFEYDS